MKIKRMKKGMVMPIVIVFFMLSQLIYLGVIQVNQTNSKHLVGLQNFYQAKVQEALVSAEINTSYQQILLDSEAVMGQQIRDVNMQQFPSFTQADWLIQSPQFGLAFINGVQPFVFVYEVEIFVEEGLIDISQEFEELVVHGGLDQRNQPIYFTASDTINLRPTDNDDTHAQLLDNNYQLVNEQTKNFQYTWRPASLEEQVFYFNTGETRLLMDNNSPRLIHSLYGSSFKNHTDLPVVEEKVYVLKHTIYYYELEVADSNHS